MLENLSTLHNVVEVVKKVVEVAEWMVATKDENLMALLKNNDVEINTSLTYL